MGRFIDDSSQKHYLNTYARAYLKRERRLDHSTKQVFADYSTRAKNISLLSADECALLIYEAEHHAKIHGWTLKRHVNYPTTDIPLSVLERGSALVTSRVYSRIMPQIQKIFGFDPEYVNVEDLFLIRYTANKQNSLEKHQDGSIFSFIVPLNDDYEGGGTEFDGIVHHSQVGEAFLFCGQQEHSGVPITKGTRYVLAGFLTRMPDDES